MEKLHRSYLILIAGLLISTSLLAQKPQDNPKYGADSVARMNCASNLSTMSEFVKIKVYEYAYLPWVSVFKKCPEASKNIYIHGDKILEYKITNAKTEEEKEAFIDTLMILYDQRIQYFGEESKVLGKKGLDLLQYRKNAIEDAYAILSQSMEKGGKNTDAAVIATYVTLANVMYKSGKIEGDAMINNYLKAMEYLGGQRTSPKTTKAIESVEKNFAESGAADCDALVSIFAPKYEASKTDIELLKKITELLEQTKCHETDLFAQASESLYSLEPSPKAGANLAMIFTTREDYSKASEYYLKAVEQETNTELKAGYYYQLGAIAMKQKQYSDVKKYGLEATKLKNDYGKAYILIGNAYAASSSTCGTSNFEKAAVYLVAVDKLLKAKSVDPSVSEEATNLINQYSKYFPNNEDAFFEGYTNGKSYTVGCWINETTTVRTTKN